MGKKIVVTGASGFLGSNLIKQIKDNDNYEIYAISSRPEELREKIGGHYVHYYTRDAIINDQAALLVDNAIIVNCAYPRNSTGSAIADGMKYIQKVFESAARNKGSAIINISSQSVYSQKRTEMATETSPVCLESPYAVGKYAVELLLESICEKSEIKYTNLRMASIIGPGFDQRIVNRFVMKLLNHETVTIVRQNKKMGFIDIDDAVRSIIAILDIPVNCWQKVYNVGTGKGYTIEEIFAAVENVLKEHVEIDNPIVETGTETSSTAVSYERIMRDTGFSPKVDLEESIRRIAAQI